MLYAAHESRDQVSAKRLRSRAQRGEIMQVYRGVYLDPEGTKLDSLTSDLKHVIRLAAISHTLSTSVVSGVSAALLHGLPIPWKHCRVPVTVTRASGGTGSRWLRVRDGELGEHEIVTVHGIRTTSLHRTLRDLHEVLGPDDLLAAADMALHLGVDLSEVLSGSRHAQGMRRLRDHASLLSESPTESRSRSILLRFGIPAPIPQLEVFDEHGKLLGRGDLGWPEFATLGEYDGRSKYGELLAQGVTATDAIFAEKDRETDIRNQGWQFARWGSELLNDPIRLVDTVNRALEIGRSLPALRGSYRQATPRRRVAPDFSPLFAQVRSLAA